MRILIFTQVLDRTDAVLGFFHTWCQVFAENVDSLVVVAQRVGEVDLPDNVEVLSLGKERGASKFSMMWRLNSWLLLARGKRRPDVTWAHMVPKFVLYLAPLCLALRIPQYLWYTHKGVDRNLRLSMGFVRNVFTASEESFRYEAGYPKRLVTGHGIDCSHFFPGVAERPVDVLTVARLAPSKGQDELLEALALLDQCPATEIAGDILLDSDESFRESLHQRAAELKGPITFLGAVPHGEVASVMSRAKIMVNVSHTGSVDKVVLEAMACGAIPLSCNESFVRVFGPQLSPRLMFEPHDPQSLAARLKEVLAMSDDERSALALDLAARVAAEHDLAALVPRMIAVMEKSL
ncbi:MAG: glycosyltransferase involved in cell wall biosynthesis [Pseudohongiellaceae bacterium]|jgi:glycosyltransferase involved in cell wall biosynthesis